MTSTTARSWALPLTAAAQFVLALDFSIVNVALDTIQRELGFSTADLQWVAIGYALTFGVLLLVGGRRADRIGYRRDLVIGLIIFGAASQAGGLAPTALPLVIARFVQGAGAAMIAPAALALLNHLQEAFQFGPLTTGFALFPATGSSFLVATQVAHRLLSRIGATRQLTAAFLLIGVGQVFLSLLNDSSGYLGGVLPGIVRTASGIGLALPAAAAVMTSTVPLAQRGIAGALGCRDWARHPRNHRRVSHPQLHGCLHPYELPRVHRPRGPHMYCNQSSDQTRLSRTPNVTRVAREGLPSGHT